MSQVNVIANILRREGKIDNFYAIHNKISLRLGARIKDLRDRGWVIKTNEQPDKNCVYTLVSDPTTPPKVPAQYKIEFINPVMA